MDAARPVYEPIDTADPAAFADRIAAVVGVPVELLSFGPTAADKVRVAGGTPVLPKGAGRP